MASGNRTVCLYITEKGRTLAQTISGLTPEGVCEPFSSDAVKRHWAKGTNLVFVMAAGIVVRTIAPLLGNKRVDPAVVVLDDSGEHAISLLSGHGGGANALAMEIGRLVGAQPVITTASDKNGLPSIDLWAERSGLAIENWKALPKKGRKLVDEGALRVFSDVAVDLPEAYEPAADASDADIVVTNRIASTPFRRDAVILRPGNLTAGIGCNAGTDAREIEDAVRKTLLDAGLSFLSLSVVGTIDKKGSEPGLLAFTRLHGLPLFCFTPDELNRVPGVAPSEAARKATGAKAVAEPSALLASGEGKLKVAKRKMGNVTVAIAESPRLRSLGTDGREDRTEAAKGAIYVVGTGPGSIEYLTPRALSAIRRSDVIVGYPTYLDLIRDLIAGKEIVSTGMAREIDRCTKAIELAGTGKRVSVISGGDPGIYAMAGLVFDLLREKKVPLPESVSIEVIPGISALNACAARLGAPLMHDFAVVSLSDRLTPWETIAGRLDAAAGADFVVVLYNPKSASRRRHIRKAQEILLRHRPGSTPVGIVKGAARQDEAIIISDLESMPFDKIDMQTTVIIGNSQTVVWNGRMITPRGYENKDAW